jgi:hypothetical protein
MCAQKSEAQFVTTHAKSTTPGKEDGVYYALPQTVLCLDFVVEEISSYRGPYSDFATRYLGATNYIRNNDKEYKILDVVMTANSDADPNATFFVTFKGKSKENPIVFGLQPNGVILSVGENDVKLDTGSKVSKTVISNESDVFFQYSMQDNTYQKLDSVVRKITVDTTVIFKNIYNTSLESRSSEQKAKLAADRLEQIRDARFKLLSGYQEVGYEPATMVYMDNELQQLENDYACLFVGKKVSRIISKKIYVIPSKELTTLTVGKFSKFDGLTIGTSGNGEPITVQTLSLQNTSKIKAPSLSAVEAAVHENKIFYRIPEMANIKVSCGERVLLEDRRIVDQLGVFALAPLNKAKLVFDPFTGQVINLKVQ